jgi:hypothetical protein
MNFTFNHSKETIGESLGVNPEELIDLQVKFEDVKKELMLNIAAQFIGGKSDGTSTSMLVEKLNNELSKEELCITLAIELRDSILSFFSQNQEMIKTLLSEDLLIKILNKN